MHMCRCIMHSQYEQSYHAKEVGGGRGGGGVRKEFSGGKYQSH